MCFPIRLSRVISKTLYSMNKKEKQTNKKRKKQQQQHK